MFNNGGGSDIPARGVPLSGREARQLGVTIGGVPPRLRQVRRGGQIHLDDGVDVAVLPGGGVLRRAGGAGEEAQSGALVAEDDQMRLLSVRGVRIVVLHGSPSMSAQGRRDVWVRQGRRARCAPVAEVRWGGATVRIDGVDPRGRAPLGRGGRGCMPAAGSCLPGRWRRGALGVRASLGRRLGARAVRCCSAVMAGQGVVATAPNGGARSCPRSADATRVQPGSPGFYSRTSPRLSGAGPAPVAGAARRTKRRWAATISHSSAPTLIMPISRCSAPLAVASQAVWRMIAPAEAATSAITPRTL